MKNAITIILILFSAQAFAQSPVTLRQVINDKDRTGVFPLDQGYRGEFTERFDEDGRGDKSDIDAQPFEFTHAFFASSKLPDSSKEGLAPNEIVVGIQPPIFTGGFRFRAPAVAIDRMPSFVELTKFQDISDYERVFGRFRGFTDSWRGLNGEQHSSMLWMGFTELEDGQIRVVSVFLRTVKKSDGWKISNRRVRDGVFKPTRKPPVLEKPEPRDARKSPNASDGN